MTAYIISLCVAIIGSNGLWAFFSTKASKKSAERESLLALLHDRIYALCNALLEQDSITLEQLENLEYLYKPYIKLGGNGTCEKLYNQVSNMPIKKE